ncbi:MAG TPA: zf-HC2 domain-containing protein [Sporichthya sp.]|nr:zf-HC2 domain-containing protein [Sporichthya sp.]
MTSKTNGLGSRVPTDNALIAAARRGDVDAFDSLADRHRDAAVKLARRTVHGNAEELVDAAITAVRTELRAGVGPATAFRPHLLTVLRRQNTSGGRRGRRARAAEAAAAALPAGCVETTAQAFRALSADAQVAIWHTEVEGEPLLETGKLLGLEATAVAELSFAARDTLRAAQLLEHRAAITSPECRWTTNRLGGFARNTLSEADTAKVHAHTAQCELCAAVAPAVVAIESDLALLVATVVLGTDAGPYLGREGAAHARQGRFAGLLRDAGRPAAVAISAIALITAGLLGTLAVADEDSAPTKAAAPSTFHAIPVAPTNPIDDSGPDSGNGSTGWDEPKATPRPTPRPVVVVHTLARSASSDVKTDPVQPAPKPAEPAGSSLNLGVTSLKITPGAGLLGLPGLSFG